MDKLKMHSLNKVEENVGKIGELFPNCVTERKNENGEVEFAIDFDMLRQELSSVIVEGNEERYQFTWPDKKKAILTANAPINKTLRPCREESVDFDNTENLYIEGDNLDVLKLLQETYLGKIKMIYIDPPYNTGNDFVYNDEFGMSSEEWDEVSGDYNEDGHQIVGKLEKNTEANGRFHTDWLNMIYPRLKLAKDLLTDDGVIFISIDENEILNIRRLCDEIFGQSNFLAQIITVSNPGGRDYKQIAIMHEYVLIYGKSINTTLNELEKEANFVMKDANGGYELRELRNRNPKFHKGNRPNLFFPFYVNENKVDKYGCCDVSLTKSDEYSIEVCPYNSGGVESVWRWGKIKVGDNLNADMDFSNVVARKKKDGSYNIYEKCRKSTSKAKSIWNETEMRNEDGTRLVRALFDKSFFDHPKPLAMIRRCLKLATDENATVMDFFSGSATTAHAVMQLNAEDGGNRKFIMVQLPEETDEKSEAYKAGYKNICEIGKERIRRAGSKIRNEKLGMSNENPDQLSLDNSSLLTTNSSLDTGFRVLKLDSTNMKDVYYNPADYDFSLFETLADNIKEDRTPEDLLFQVMLDLGILLSSKIQMRNEQLGVRNYTYYDVADGFLIACFDNDVTEEVIKEIAQKQPYYFVMRDSSMATDSVATNFEQIFGTYSPDTVRKVL